MNIVNCLDDHDFVDSSEFDNLQEAYSMFDKEFMKYSKKSERLEAKLEESNKLVNKYKKIVEKT